MIRPSAESVFHEARQLSGAEQAAYLKGACGDDLAFRVKVEGLLEADAEAGSFMDTIEPGGSHADPTLRAAASEASGQLVGRYKLLQPIGEGGFGTVWMAEQREPVKRRVALKIIKLGMDTKQVIARFEAERQALAMMDHPNIAKVLDAGSTETGRPFFAMEYIKGVPILDYCDTERLDTRSRLELFTQVCHAIQHAHQKGIIHRDIKPSNVLITMHDGVPVPKVIDFGIAKATNTELTQRTLFTEHRQMIGTPAYMSPEQAEMSGLDIDTRSDVYSLGVLLYELLTGTTPFDSDSLRQAGFAEMMRIIREEEPHRPSTRLSFLGETATRTAAQRRADAKRLESTLRGDLDWIVMRCLEKDRTRRYETANGLAADIKRHLADEPVVAGPPSAGYRLGKFVKRNRGQVIAAGLVTAALMLAVVGTSAGLAWALREKERADGEAARATLAAAAETEARLAAQANEQKAIDEAVRAERELARATEIKSLITEMLESVRPSVAQTADIALLKDILGNAAERLRAGEIADELVAAELHAVIGGVYLSLGLYDDAERHLPIASEIRRRLLGPEHPQTVYSTIRLGVLRLYRDQFAEAEPLLREVLQIQTRLRGPDDPETLWARSRLALFYLRQERFDEAEALYVQTLDDARRILGDEHIDTLSSMNQLALLYRHVGRYDEAEELLAPVVRICKRLYPDDHSLIIYMTNLARVYWLQDRHEEYRPLLEETLEMRVRLWGEKHRESTKIMNELGWNLVDLGEPDAALRRAQRACAIAEEEGFHELLWNYLDTLARAQYAIGDTVAAVETQRRAVTLMPVGLDPEVPERLAEYEAALAADAAPVGDG